ncbi:low molecular weight protein tyrosine phosphatase family protein [Gemmata sp.]|uniref:low molecular weight protein tyrosine phosphatase family protein n=1 Tax=Gemmata sp. TaxID=1914242 RepID=UPI003F70D5DB
MRLLFVCARNRLRSPTAERVFAAVAGVEAESAGVAPDADNPVTPELIAWADVILVMEATHRAKLTRLFPAALCGKRVVCLNVPDAYDYMDPELVRLLRDRVGRAVPTLASDASE